MRKLTVCLSIIQHITMGDSGLQVGARPMSRKGGETWGTRLFCHVRKPPFYLLEDKSLFCLGFQHRVHINLTTRNCNLSFPGFEARLLYRYLVLACGYSDVGRGVADEAAVDFDVGGVGGGGDLQLGGSGCRALLGRTDEGVRPYVVRGGRRSGLCCWRWNCGCANFFAVSGPIAGDGLAGVLNRTTKRDR